MLPWGLVRFVNLSCSGLFAPVQGPESPRSYKMIGGQQGQALLYLKSGIVPFFARIGTSRCRIFSLKNQVNAEMESEIESRAGIRFLFSFGGGEGGKNTEFWCVPLFFLQF